MINGKKERFEKILRVRYRNLQVHKGWRALFICLVVLYFVWDLLGIVLPFVMADPTTAFIMSVLKAVTIGVFAICVSAKLFASDRKNNQIGIEQRSGYDASDIFLSRLITIVAGYLIFFLIYLVINGAIFGGLTDGKLTKKIFGNPYFDANKGGTPYLIAMVDFLIIDIWYGLITFILCAGITIGCSYIMNAGESTAMGIIFGLGISAVIMVASVGTFSHGANGFLTTIPGFASGLPIQWWGMN